MSRVLGASAVLALASAAHAQLVVGYDEGGGVDTIYLIDLDDNLASPIAAGLEVWGLAADDEGGALYVADGSVLYRADYAGPGGLDEPVLVGTITGAGGAGLTTTGLAWANGTLYSSRTIASDTNPEGIYQIDPATGAATLVLGVVAGDYDFGGLAFDPVTGLFYATNDDTTTGRGLYSIDALGDGSIELVVDFPAGETDIDGLAIGDGVAYFVEDEPGTFSAYDLATGTFLAPVTSPFPESALFSGGAWAPRLLGDEPGCPADRDDDNDADVQDLLSYLSDFRAGDADFDGDQDTDVQDLLSYLSAFRTGC